MTAVPQTYHLARRNGVWSYRRRVPTRLIENFGKKVIQFSVETSSLKEAKKRRAAEDLKWTTQFEAAEKQLNGKGASENKIAASTKKWSLSDRDVIRLVQEYVEQTDVRARDRLLRDPPDSEQQKAEIKTDVEIGQQILRNRDDPRADELIYGTVTKILRSAGIPAEQEGLPCAELAEIVRRGLLELDQRKLARLDDDHRNSFFDQQFSPARVREVSFKEIAAQFLQSMEERAAANRTSQKWVDKQRAHVVLILEIVGENTPVQAVDYDLCTHLRSVLARLPSNRTKIYSGYSIDDAIAQAEAKGKARLSSFTQERYLATFKEILDLAAKKRLISVNPAEGMRPLKRDTIAPGAKRRSFSPEQLKQFFENKFYRECAEHSPPYGHDKGGWRFWLPLLCLFMGMRPNEACQMNTTDIKRTDQGTWYVDVVASEDEEDSPSAQSPKTLKTAASKRRIPVHPELVAIGFLKFVDARKAKTGPRLFPDLKPDGYGNQATYALKRFRELYLPKAITLAPRQSFYSFRHNFRDALRRINAPPDALQALGGWSQGKLTSDDYGDKSNPDYQAQFMKQVAFPGLNVSHLHAK